MAGMKSSISMKTTLKVNLVLLVFLVIGGVGIGYYQNSHFDRSKRWLNRSRRSITAKATRGPVLETIVLPIRAAR